MLSVSIADVFFTVYIIFISRDVIRLEGRFKWHYIPEGAELTKMFPKRLQFEFRRMQRMLMLMPYIEHVTKFSMSYECSFRKRKVKIKADGTQWLVSCFIMSTGITY